MRYWAPLYDAVGRRIGVLDEATAGCNLHTCRNRWHWRAPIVSKIRVGAYIIYAG